MTTIQRSQLRAPPAPQYHFLNDAGLDQAFAKTKMSDGKAINDTLSGFISKAKGNPTALPSTLGPHVTVNAGGQKMNVYLNLPRSETEKPSLWVETSPGKGKLIATSGNPLNPYAEVVNDPKNPKRKRGHGRPGADRQGRPVRRGAGEAVGVAGAAAVALVAGQLTPPLQRISFA